MRWRRFDRWLWAGLAFVSLEAQGAMDVESECALSAMAHERSRTARASRLPDLQIGLNGGVIGQPIVFQRGLSAATYPDTPDWSQNYAIDFLCD